MTMPTYLELNPWHKRQATLLHYFTSIDYLMALLPLVNEWIAYTDQVLTERSPLDAVGLGQANWAPVNTTAHFSTHAFAAMVEFKEAIQRSAAARAYEEYRAVGEYQCARVLQEYAGMSGRDNGDFLWATPEQESHFKGLFRSIYAHAGNISRSVAPMRTRSDFTFWSMWQEHAKQFPRIPKFRVCADVVGESGRQPVRTGVYVPQDDPYGALQFAWTGGKYGALGDTYTLNGTGHRALHAVGRQGLWGDKAGLLRFASGPEHVDMGVSLDELISEPSLAPSAVARESFERKACMWYFVEMVNDEYEDHDGTYIGATEMTPQGHPRNVSSGQRVPESGWWFTPAAMGQSARYFEAGEIFPDLPGSTYGATFWQWSSNQSVPAPR